MENRIKIIVFYILGVLLIGLYLYMDSSAELWAFVEKADRVRTDAGFTMYVTVGIIQFTALVAGVTIIATLTFHLVKELLKKKETVKPKGLV